MYTFLIQSHGQDTERPPLQLQTERGSALIAASCVHFSVLHSCTWFMHGRISIKRRSSLHIVCYQSITPWLTTLPNFIQKFSDLLLLKLRHENHRHSFTYLWNFYLIIYSITSSIHAVIFDLFFLFNNKNNKFQIMSGGFSKREETFS